MIMSMFCGEEGAASSVYAKPEKARVRTEGSSRATLSAISAPRLWPIIPFLPLMNFTQKILHYLEGFALFVVSKLS
jgi:hypothetical protein